MWQNSMIVTSFSLEKKKKKTNLTKEWYGKVLNHVHFSWLGFIPTPPLKSRWLHNDQDKKTFALCVCAKLTPQIHLILFSGGGWGEAKDSPVMTLHLTESLRAKLSPHSLTHNSCELLRRPGQKFSRHETHHRAIMLGLPRFCMISLKQKTGQRRKKGVTLAWFHVNSSVAKIYFKVANLGCQKKNTESSQLKVRSEKMMKIPACTHFNHDRILSKERKKKRSRKVEVNEYSNI